MPIGINNTVYNGMSDVFNNETGIIINNRKPHSDYEVDRVDLEDPDELLILNLRKNVT